MSKLGLAGFVLNQILVFGSNNFSSVNKSMASLPKSEKVIADPKEFVLSVYVYISKAPGFLSKLSP